MLKELTITDIQKLIEEYEALADWNQVKAFAETYYGPAAVSVELSYEVELSGDQVYDDIFYSVTDADGKELSPDSSLPFWQEEETLNGMARTFQPTFQSLEEWMKDCIEEGLNDKLPSREINWKNHLIFDLTQAPTITYPKVFAEIA